MNTAACLVCQSDSERVPLLAMQYRGGSFAICPQHLPIIIHQPDLLIGILEGAENLEPSAHTD
jgi:hypothetical protein